MDKVSLLTAIADHFQKEFDLVMKAAMATYEAATHEENRAENKYDTRGLEASYLAESQSKRAQELKLAVQRYRDMKPIVFGEDDPIAQGALITLSSEEGEQDYFLGPVGGGTQIHWNDRFFTIITGASPLGRQLVGSEVGDVVILHGASREREREIIAIA
ncbi:hypothetical protein [Acanthopleuribacter pedis]|uniref:Transcription elongation factor GreAB n=1 Tax=Acanthopleuribacter pedis TaxID=442870 RepID=A0A8J7QFD7_9BACT|nr:hypothetical protein [Acanthopleuribacter pedis]MBO1317410.1 hypothetical protein [Acanthopleuribacter pedis]